MEFTLIQDYIQRSKAERQEHLRLQDPCIEIGGRSDQFKALLAYKLHTTIPHGRSIHLCHACENAKCSNPDHLYWGTVKENRQDALASGRNPGKWSCVCGKVHYTAANTNHFRY